MVGARLYDLMYRFWAPWDAAGVRDDLRAFLDEQGISPAQYPRAVDLGCGSGANVVHLASIGFDAEPTVGKISEVSLEESVIG